MANILRTVAGLEMFALTVGVWAFALLFHVLADWKESAMGRHMMSFMVTCGLVLTWAWVGFIFEIDEAIRGWVRVILYGALAFVVWRQVKILIKLQVISRTPLPDNPATRGAEQ
jgi:hypothetical protein